MRLLLLSVLTVGLNAQAQITSLFVDGEHPSGVINGVNTHFTLANLPNPLSSVHLYRNGIRQAQALASNYTMQTTTVQVGGVPTPRGQIVFTVGSIPQPGDVLLADYRYDTLLTTTGSGLSSLTNGNTIVMSVDTTEIPTFVLTTPSASTDGCVPMTLANDSTYLYICIPASVPPPNPPAGQWVRLQLITTPFANTAPFINGGKAQPQPPQTKKGKKQ